MVGDNIILRVPSLLMSSSSVDSCVFNSSFKPNLDSQVLHFFLCALFTIHMYCSLQYD